MTYIVLSGAVGFIAFVVTGIRLLLKAASRTESGDHVTQAVLTRINTEYHDLP